LRVPLQPAPGQTSPPLLLLGLLIALPALGTDLFVPSLPALAQSLGAPVSAGQMTLTAYFVGLAGGMLVWGPLSDRFGRRPVLVAGLATMLAASLAASLMESIAGVAAARLAQGLAMSSGAVVVRSIVRDLHAHEQAARLLARVTIVFSVVPIAAPLAGAQLAGGWGWQAVFWGMALAAAALLAAVLAWLRETAPSPRPSIHPLAVGRSFAALACDPRLLPPYLLMLSTQMGLLAWVSNSAFTLVRGFGVSTTAYGWMFALVMVGQITGAWSSSRLVLRLGMARLMRAGTLITFGAGLLLAALAWAGVSHWAAVVLPFAVFLYGSALILPNATSVALSPFPGSAGAVSSLLGAGSFTAAALISTLLGATFDGTARPMATVAALCGVLALVFERKLSRGKA
jgi:DHA1 family bicyclomycin/chloramphenicol resistance-like MFS transporter